MAFVSGSILVYVFDLEFGIGLAAYALLLGILARALWQDRRAPRNVRLHHRSHR